MKSIIKCIVMLFLVVCLLPINVLASESKNEKDQDIGSKLIFVGDSRTVGMETSVQHASQSDLKYSCKSVWSAKVGAGLSWMKTDGVPNIESEIDQNSSIVILMGANDAMNKNGYKAYCEYINKKAKEWVELGADVYYVSVNPVDYYQYATLTEKDIVSWNENMKDALSNDIEYIDTYSKIDGQVKYMDYLHYQSTTYVEIYNLILEHIYSRQEFTNKKISFKKHWDSNPMRFEVQKTRLWPSIGHALPFSLNFVQ